MQKSKSTNTQLYSKYEHFNKLDSEDELLEKIENLWTKNLKIASELERILKVFRNNIN